MGKQLVPNTFAEPLPGYSVDWVKRGEDAATI
jgi:hypothetical protein